MDGKAHPISSSDLYARLGTASAPLLLDVRRDEAFNQDGGLIISALRRSPGRCRALVQGSARRSAGRGLLRARARGQPGRGGEPQSGRHRRRLSRRRHRRLEGAGPADAQEPRRRRGQVGDARASQDRPHRVSMADQPLHQSAGGVPLRSGRPGGQRSPSRKTQRPTTSRAFSSATSATTARSTRSSRLSRSRIRRSIIWRRSCAAPTRRGPTSRRNARACWRSPMDCRPTIPTTTRCSSTAW